MREIKPSTQLWLGAWEVMQDRSNELFRLLTRDGKRLDLEAIHDLRVASRRLREGLALFSPCFPQRHLTALRSRLKRLTNTLGAIRNTDEALHFFALLAANVSAPANSAAEELVLTLQAQRQEELAALKKNLKAISPTALRGLFDQACNHPLIFNTRDVDPLQPIADFLKTAIAAREAPLGELYPLACVPGNVTAQHRLRIAVKRFRYRMEYFSFLEADGYAELYPRTKGFHDILGHLHDLDVFSTLVTQKVPDPLAQQAMQDLIARKRQALFAEFLRQDTLCPVTSLGERLRRLL
jgi:CHAD domain-containing protein